MKLNKVDYLLCILFALIAFISRAPLIEHIQSHWDGPQYSIAVVRYSFEQQTPAPLGYPIYIGLAKLFYIFFHDPHRSILAVSVFASVCGAIVLFLVGKYMFNRTVGIIATSIFLTGSTFYYFGLTAYPYLFLPVTDALLACIVYFIFIKKRQLGIAFGAVLGISFGIRPQELGLVGLLSIVGFLFLSNKQKAYAVLIFCIITLSWLVPLVHTSGGIKHYTEINVQAIKGDLIHYSLPHNSELMIKGFLLSFGISSIFLLYYLFALWRKKQFSNWRVVLFYALWIVPGFYFNFFVRTEHAGYQMSYLEGFLFLIAYAVWKTTERSKKLTALAVFCIAVFNLSWFFYNRDPHYTKPYRPTSFHYSDIRKNDLQTGSKVNFVQKTFNPKKTLIITTDYLWRPYMYYLKHYKIIVLTS